MSEPTVQDTLDAASEFLKLATAARDGGTLPNTEQASDLIDVGNDLLGIVGDLSTRLAVALRSVTVLAEMCRAGERRDRAHVDENERLESAACGFAFGVGREIEEVREYAAHYDGDIASAISGINNEDDHV